MLNDYPIESFEQDEIGRKAFVFTVKEAIDSYFAQDKRSKKESIAIGINGSWGAGKTSVLNLLEKEFDANYQVIHFNPWMVSDAQSLVSEFFKELMQKLSNFPEAKEKINKFIKTLSFGTSFLKLIPIIGEQVEATSNKILDNISDVLTKEPSISSQKTELSKILVDNDLKVVVIIDDIDRCMNDEIISVFKLIKAIINLPNIVFIVAADFSKLIKSLNSPIIDSTFLTKIFQFYFHLYSPANMLRDKFFQYCKIENEFLREAEICKFLTKRVNSIREYKRLINNCDSFCDANSSIEYNRADVLGVQYLQIYNPEVYALVSANKKALCLTPYLMDDFALPENVESISQEAKEDAGLLKLLFTRINNTGKTLKQDYLSLSVGQSCFFDNYFYHDNYNFVKNLMPKTVEESIRTGKIKSDWYLLNACLADYIEISYEVLQNIEFEKLDYEKLFDFIFNLFEVCAKLNFEQMKENKIGHQYTQLHHFLEYVYEHTTEDRFKQFESIISEHLKTTSYDEMIMILNDLLMINSYDKSLLFATIENRLFGTELWTTNNKGTATLLMSVLNSERLRAFIEELISNKEYGKICSLVIHPTVVSGIVTEVEFTSQNIAEEFVRKIIEEKKIGVELAAFFKQKDNRFDEYEFAGYLAIKNGAPYIASSYKIIKLKEIYKDMKEK